jgi:hypothetical protein
VRRNWAAARHKVELEGKCRNCGTTDVHLEAAHILGRRADRRPPLNWNEDLDGMWGEPFEVSPARIVPLCGPSGESSSCHCRYDEHKLDLLPLLNEDEQLQAVADAAGIELARRRLLPSAYPSKVAAGV